MNYDLPILIHCESGKKALLEEDAVITYWVRYRDFWVPDDSPFFRWGHKPMMMTVDELIERLRTLPPKAQVCAYEGEGAAIVIKAGPHPRDWTIIRVQPS